MSAPTMRGDGGDRGLAHLSTEQLHVVLGDATVERLRTTAVARGIELEQLIVLVIDRASRQPDAVLGATSVDKP